MTEMGFLSGEAIAFEPLVDLKASADGTGDGLFVLAQRSSPAAWHQDCIKRIERLRELKHNWDSYGANPVDRGSIEFAKQLVREFAQVTGIDCPRVAASPAGHVALSWEWQGGSRELDLEILPDGMLRYSYLDEKQPNADAEGDTADLNRIVQLLTQW